MRKAVVYILIIIGLLSICIGTNYDYISNIIGKDKSETKGNTNEPEKEKTKNKTNLIDENDYATGIAKYYESIDKMKTSSYFIEDINNTEVTAKEAPGLGEEYVNINDQPAKKNKLSSDVKIYLYDLRSTTDETAKASGDESIKYKKLTIEETKTILSEANTTDSEINNGKEITAYYEIDNDKVVQILIVMKDLTYDTIVTSEE